MATIRRRGSKWEAQIRRKGYRTISRSFDTQTDAKTWARQIEVGLELGNLELPEKSKGTSKNALWRQNRGIGRHAALGLSVSVALERLV